MMALRPCFLGQHLVRAKVDGVVKARCRRCRGGCLPLVAIVYRRRFPLPLFVAAEAGAGGVQVAQRGFSAWVLESVSSCSSSTWCAKLDDEGAVGARRPARPRRRVCRLTLWAQRGRVSEHAVEESITRRAFIVERVCGRSRWYRPAGRACRAGRRPYRSNGWGWVLAVDPERKSHPY